jgi:hypothetical protein
MQLTFDPPPPPQPGEPIFTLEVPGRLPSWNDILGMEQWARYKFKGELATAFLCALRASAADSSTKITSAKSTTLIYAATLESYLAMRREQRRLKSAKKKLDAKILKESLLKSEGSNKVPF